MQCQPVEEGLRAAAMKQEPARGTANRAATDRNHPTSGGGRMSTPVPNTGVLFPLFPFPSKAVAEIGRIEP